MDMFICIKTHINNLTISNYDLNALFCYNFSFTGYANAIFLPEWVTDEDSSVRCDMMLLDE
jgi:hypothetical protein